MFTSCHFSKVPVNDVFKLPVTLSFSVAIDLALSSCSSQCNLFSLRFEALSWPSTSAALLRLVTALRSLSAASLIFNSRWISCLSRVRASSKRCWNSGSRISPSTRPCRLPLWRTHHNCFNVWTLPLLFLYFFMYHICITLHIITNYPKCLYCFSQNLLVTPRIGSNCLTYISELILFHEHTL